MIDIVREVIGAACRLRADTPRQPDGRFHFNRIELSREILSENGGSVVIDEIDGLPIEITSEAALSSILRAKAADSGGAYSLDADANRNIIIRNFPNVCLLPAGGPIPMAAGGPIPKAAAGPIPKAAALRDADECRVVMRKILDEEPSQSMTPTQVVTQVMKAWKIDPKDENEKARIAAEVSKAMDGVEFTFSIGEPLANRIQLVSKSKPAKPKAAKGGAAKPKASKRPPSKKKP